MWPVFERKWSLRLAHAGEKRLSMIRARKYSQHVLFPKTIEFADGKYFPRKVGRDRWLTRPASLVFVLVNLRQALWFGNLAMSRC
jgi:hypothetical protein